MEKLFEIVMLVCLSGNPNACEERGITTDFKTQPMCTMAAQPMMAAWLNQHPKYELRKWACVAQGSRGQDI